MHKHIRLVDEKRKIVQVTTTDERWYVRESKDPVTGLPSHKFVPSVTWICDHYPKGVGFYKWLANKGWDEAEAIKEAAGGRGSKVHQAVADLLDGLVVEMEAQYINPNTGLGEPLTLEEYEAILSFVSWFKLTHPKVLGREMVVWNDQEEYAGTVDFLCEIDKELWLIDFKTSKSVYPSHEMQVSAYKHAVPNWSKAKLGILQLGYARMKAGYKFTLVEDQFDLFLASKKIWAKETAGQSPKQKDYPLSVVLVESNVEAAAAATTAPVRPSTVAAAHTNGG